MRPGAERNQSNILKWDVQKAPLTEKARHKGFNCVSPALKLGMKLDVCQGAVPPLEIRNQDDACLELKALAVFPVKENNYSVFSPKEDADISASLKSPRACAQAGDGAG